MIYVDRFIYPGEHPKIKAYVKRKGIENLGIDAIEKSREILAKSIEIGRDGEYIQNMKYCIAFVNPPTNNNNPFVEFYGSKLDETNNSSNFHFWDIENKIIQRFKSPMDGNDLIVVGKEEELRKKSDNFHAFIRTWPDLGNLFYNGRIQDLPEFSDLINNEERKKEIENEKQRERERNSLKYEIIVPYDYISQGRENTKSILNQIMLSGILIPKLEERKKTISGKNTLETYIQTTRPIEKEFIDEIVSRFIFVGKIGVKIEVII